MPQTKHCYNTCMQYMSFTDSSQIDIPISGSSICCHHWLCFGMFSFFVTFSAFPVGVQGPLQHSDKADTLLGGTIPTVYGEYITLLLKIPNTK